MTEEKEDFYEDGEDFHGDYDRELQMLEKSLLGAFLTYGKKAVDQFPDLRVEHFFFKEHREIFAEIERCNKLDMKISTLSIAQKLTEYQGYMINATVSAVPITDIKPYAKFVISRSLRRSIKQTCEKIIEDCENDSDTSEEDLLSTMHSQSIVLSKGISRSRFRTDREVDYELCEDLSKPVVAYPTGINCLDRVMVGGLHAGRSYCFAAAPKAGKSAMLATISENLAEQKIKHLYIVLEMGAKELRMRIMSRRMAVNSLRFYDKEKSEEFKDDAARNMVKSQGDVIILDEANLKFEEMQKLLTLAVINYGIKGFILDYVQLVLGCKPKENKAYFIESICQWIAGFCKQEKIFGVYAAQLNSEGEVRGSQGAVQACDQVYYLHKYPDNDLMRQHQRWMKMRVSRYTALSDIGSEHSAGLRQPMWQLF